MRIAVPASAAFDIQPKVRASLSILGQTATIESKSVFLDKKALNALHVTKNQSVRFKPLSVGELVARLDKLRATEQVVLLTPSPSFDSTPYHNILHTLTDSQADIYGCMLNCYGNALAFLITGVLRFQKQYNPSIEQIALYLKLLNESVYSYVIAPRSRVFEPTLPLWQQWLSPILDKETGYQSTGTGWQTCSFQSIGKTIAKDIEQGTLVWIDVQQGEEQAKPFVKRLRSWGLKDKHIVYQNLTHSSRDFPNRFVLVTICPNKSRLQGIGEWALRY